MALQYTYTKTSIADRLSAAHNPKVAIIRGLFFEKENAFFKKHVTDKRVLVAGSGLGHDVFELAKHNTSVVGVELLPDLVSQAKGTLDKLRHPDIEFVQGDIFNLEFEDRSFDVAILNMGTIGNFDDKERLIRELLRVSYVAYFDFYPPSVTNLAQRKQMYSEEGWKNVRISGTTIVSDDGLESKSCTIEEFKKIASNLNTEIEFSSFHEFSVMACIHKET